MKFRAYIDESYDGERFALTVATASDLNWSVFEQRWSGSIAHTNEQLLSAGRAKLTRYHASECAGFGGEFAGWSLDEQKALTSKLIEAVKATSIHSITYILNFSDLQAAHLLATGAKLRRDNCIDAGYFLTTQFCLSELVRFLDRSFGKHRLDVVFDQCDYDLFFDRATQLLASYGYDSISSVQPADSRLALPLQVADFIAYENLKEQQNIGSGRRRRRSLELLLASGTGFVSRVIKQDALRKILKFNSAAAL